ncbi:unnamed protein product [Bursaphelenchus okinawaensis]|uniref:Metalloendopeptidase n=1 Tax=Bursaphelenchus okinawaensis TaxID=465554 RepID=A0A811KDE5_9BILA|nr:unnamed protein product [Bursaphelenchus okinawaensis]CAG9101632.1 unnamed protein product [Bursaphelenchus okinawaensis]
MKNHLIFCLLLTTVASQGLLDNIGKLLGNLNGEGGPGDHGGGGGGGRGWGPQGGPDRFGGPGDFRGPPPGPGPFGGRPPPGSGGWGGGPPPRDEFGVAPGGGGIGQRPGGPGNGPGGVLNLNGLLGNVMNEVGHAVQTGHFDLRSALAHITEGTGLEGIYQKLSNAGKNFLAPKPTERGIPPHVLRRIIRFCSRPENRNHPKCQGHPEWQSDDTLPEGPGQFNSINDVFDLLNFQLPPLPQLAQQYIFGNVPENLKEIVPKPTHKLSNEQKTAILNKCKGGACLKQPVDVLNRRASIAEHEASVRKLFSPGKSQTEIDKDIETRFARTHQLKKAILTKSGISSEVEPHNDGVFQNDILLTTEQAEAMINAVNNDDPGTVPVVNRGGRKKRSSLFFEEQLVKKWPAGAIPYVFDSSLSASEQQTIQSAISEIQSKTCLKFQKLASRPSSSHIFYVKYDSTAFCGLSNIGLNNLGNPVYLTFRCTNQPAKGVAIHETLHALGLAHEHVRSDRDDHITVNWANVDPQNYQFFGVNDAKLFSSYGVTYDYGSIMHYANTIAAKSPGAITMTALQNNGANGPLMGQRNGLSQHDVEILNKMYCKPATCKDENIYCGIWANRGKCSNAPNAWIFQHCKKSCNYC